MTHVAMNKLDKLIIVIIKYIFFLCAAVSEML